ncbi:MAG: glycosyltransferase family 9 protein [Candidatus Aenigmarchaeota archaeon]|nr:glycosyltransferase family 9 protein [Candidatus Aenigmarchaeota archaeon]
MKKIAVIKGSSMGDILTGIPMLRSLKKKWPDSKIYLVHNYSGSGVQLLKSSPYIDEDVIINFSASGLRNLAKIRSQKLDIVIDGFPNTFMSSVLSLLLGASLTASYRNPRNAASSLYNVAVETGGDAVELEARVLEKLGIKSDGKMEMPVPEKCEKIKTRGIVVGINAGKDDNLCRAWNDEGWVSLIKMIKKKYPSTILLLGGKDNALRAQYIEREAGDVVNLVGKTGMDGLTCAINQCDVFISINGGPMHVAAALAKPQIALNGPSLPEWNPHNSKATCMGGRQFCNTRCNDNYCHYGDMRCIKTITPEQVMEKFDVIVKKMH